MMNFYHMDTSESIKDKRSIDWLNFRRLLDQAGGKLFLTTTGLPFLIVAVMIVVLLVRTMPIITIKPLDKLLFGNIWLPFKGEFGFFPFLIGTLWVTILAMLLAVPPCLLNAIYLSEYAHITIRATLKPLLDLLAGIPSVVYGVWGVITIVPWVQSITPDVSRWFGMDITNPTGYGVLAGGIVLAVMVAPVIISVAYEVMEAVPHGIRQASLAVGATKWQTVKSAVLPKAMPGIIAAIVLGFSRAFGETMAVLMVVGNVPKVPHNILDPAYPLTALIANNYGEMMSIPLYDAALMGASLLLLIIVLIFNLIAAFILQNALKQTYE
jgi:phosphate transport system permease protein